MEASSSVMAVGLMCAACSYFLLNRSALVPVSNSDYTPLPFHHASALKPITCASSVVTLSPKLAPTANYLLCQKRQVHKKVEGRPVALPNKQGRWKHAYLPCLRALYGKLSLKLAILRDFRKLQVSNQINIIVNSMLSVMYNKYM